jgi:glyoxylate reductase
VVARKYVIASMSPLPEVLVREMLAPYIKELGDDVDIEVVGLFGKPRDVVLRELERADVVIGDYTFQMKVDAEMCRDMKKVRLLQQPSTGYDHIDVEACREAGVPVANAGGANAVSVAEYTIMVALALLKRLMEAHERTRRGEWPQWELMEKGTYDLEGKTWGIIGLGRIGREVAKRLKPFGVKVLYYDVRRLSPEEERELGVEYRSLPRLLRESDIVSIHVPLTEQTRGMIGERELRMMKPTAILINPSRGEVVDEEALARALREGWIMGAAVDVYSREPPPRDDPLLALEGVNLITTPHIAGANTDARARIIEFSIRNIIRALRGEKPEAVVNM